MSRYTGVVFILLWAVALMAVAPERAYADKALFTGANCNKCHTISAAGVEQKKGGGDEEEEDDDGGKVVDLSHAGKHHDAAFLVSYLKKEKEHVPHDDVKSAKKHKVKYKGSDQDLQTLSNWLASMK